MTTSRRQFITAIGALTATPALSAAALGCASHQETALAEKQAGSKVRKIPALSATLILMRHTEKKTDDRTDPDLSEAGVERAKELARMFGSAGVTRLIHTQFKRTRNTLAPLAEALGLESTTIGGADSKMMLKMLEEAGPDEVIAIAGHSNTIPQIAWHFGVDLPDLEAVELDPPIEYGFLPHGAYDRAHVLTPGKDAARLVELRYGKPSKTD